MALLAQAVARDGAGSMIGKQLGAYQILCLVGAGGLGEVYQARDTRLGRLVALKILPPGVATDPERKRRFLHEARAASKLNHPHIVTLHDVGSEDGVVLWRSKLDGSERLQLAFAPMQAATPRWSPDGNRIAFSTRTQASLLRLTPSRQMAALQNS
jgi:serine/threonine protein kinase